MKESISYSFLINIIILFIFVCAAIITGIFSYYRAFRANTIITNEIEKYEGYNCLSEESIQKKLYTILYNVPFNVECKASYGKPCITDSNNNYAIVSYNLDYSNGKYMGENDENKYASMNSMTNCDMNNPVFCDNTRKYQYGIYTYMYTNLPIVSNFLKIPVFSKTKVLYEFRDLYSDANNNLYDSRFLPDTYIGTNDPLRDVLDDPTTNYIYKAFNFSIEAHKYYVETILARKSSIKSNISYSRDILKYSIEGGTIMGGYQFKCGNKIDYSKY